MYSAVRAPPMCRAPVGDGANRTRILDTACHQTKASRSDADRRPRLPAGGPAKAVERGEERGCRRSRSSTRARAQWRPRVYADEQVAAFHEAMEASTVDALLIHAVYLINCASEDPEIREKSLTSLTASLRAGAALGAVGVVLHPGSALKDGGDAGTAMERAAEVIAEALKESEGLPAAPRGHRRRRRDARAAPSRSSRA